MPAQYGQFDAKNREYVITNPLTPLPWINYIGNDDFLGLVSHTGGGYTFYRDARLRRLTRYRYNNSPLDMNGRYIYVRLPDGTVFSPTFKPCMRKPDKYRCRHGLGYSVIESENCGIAASVRYFIPANSDNVEIWDLTVRNLRNAGTTLDVFPYAEWCLWEALDDMTNFQRNYSCGEVVVGNNIICHVTEYRERRDHYAYFSSSEKAVAFETRREEFLGRSGSLLLPGMVSAGRLANGVAHGWAPIASQQIRLKLEKGAEKRVIFMLGYAENPESKKFVDGKVNTSVARAMVRKYSDPRAVDAAFEALGKRWKEILSGYRVECSDANVSLMVNTWNQVQNMTTFRMSRSASIYESGIGRGMGFRDSNQDLLGFMHIDPAMARQRIYDLAATQLENGHAYHQFQPLTKRGNAEIGSNYNDDPMWLVLSAIAYLKETADFGFLDEKIPFENDRRKAAPLFEHLRRSLKFTVGHKGPHGLPLIGRADWNDCLNFNMLDIPPGVTFAMGPAKDGKVAESVLIGFLFVHAAKEFIKVCHMLHCNDDVRWLEKEVQSMEKALVRDGWDGAWWRRAYDDNGDPVGSSKCEEGRIYIEPQGWAVIAGVGGAAKQEKAMVSVRRHLACGDGIVLHWPAYQSYHKNIGEISTFPPGYKENGSVFCHTNPWIIIGECLLKNRDRAFDYYMRTCPPTKQDRIDIYKCEPYVYSQTVAGKEAPTPGEAKNSWLTGTASWMFVAVSQYLLGVRPDYKGLLVDPGVPESFGDYTVTRRFRGTVYRLEIAFSKSVKEPYQVEAGKKSKGNFIVHEPGRKERTISLYFKK